VCSRMLAVVLMVGALIGASGQGELADPTRPARSLRHSPSVTETAGAALTLQSVMLSQDRRVAVINGRSVQPGDRVFGARVVEISLSAVRLRRADGEILLTLTGNSFKKPSPKRGDPR
jgi:MSHA biogenesis protein MshK